MRNNNKKGFTLTELVVVIAIIAILLAVLIPMLFTYVDKARISNDNQLVRNLNTALTNDALLKGKKHANMQEALDAADEAGYNVGKINAQKTDNEILWDSKNDVFCYLNNNKLEYIPNSIAKGAAIDLDKKPGDAIYLWQILDITDTTNLSGNRFSVYAKSATENLTVNTNKGFDAGNTTSIVSVNYANTAAGQEVVIRTNSFDTTLTINAPKDTVKHYDKVGTLNIVAVANASYHENGEVKFVEISKGRIALEAGAEVAHIHINAKVVENVKQDEFEEIIISKASSVEMPSFSRDDVEIAAQGTLVVALQTGTEEITESTELDYVWLTKQGVYEQITVSENNTSAGTTWVNTSNKPAETKTAAQQIANNIGTTATVGETTYDVAVDETTRDIVLKETGTDTVAYTVTVEEGKTVVTTTGENPTTVEVEVVEAQPDKEDVQIGATLFAGGTGTENNPFLIVDYDTMQKVSEVYHNTFGYGVNYYYNLKDNNGNWVCDTREDAEAMAIANGYNRNNDGPFYFKVKDGISAIDCNQDGRSWIPVELLGYFDGNGVVFNNVNKGLFNSANGDEVIIKNFTINANISVSGGVGAVVYDSNTLNLTIDSVDVHGTIIGANWVTPYVEFGPGPSYVWNLTIKNSVSDATLVAISASASGFVGHPYDDVSNGSVNGSSLITIIDSAYIGNMTATGSVTGGNFKYFTINGNDNRIKTYYSEEFIEKLGFNPEGTLYNTPATGYDNKGKANEVEYLVINNEDGSKTFFCGNSGKNVFDNYKPTEKKAVLNTTSQATLPANIGDVFTVTKVSGAVKAVVSLQIAPNDQNNYGGYLGTYMSEEIDISSVASGSTFTSEEVRYFTININSGATSKTGVSGNIFNVVNSYYGKNAHNGASVKIAQFDANGNVLNITSIQIAAPHAAE